MLGSTTPAGDCMLLKSVAGGGGVRVSLPEMLKEATHRGKKSRAEMSVRASWAWLSEGGWDRWTLPLRRAAALLAKQTHGQKRVPESSASV